MNECGTVKIAFVEANDFELIHLQFTADEYPIDPDEELQS